MGLSLTWPSQHLLAALHDAFAAEADVKKMKNRRSREKETR